jgi:hypothetical protein
MAIPAAALCSETIAMSPEANEYGRLSWDCSGSTVTFDNPPFGYLDNCIEVVRHALTHVRLWRPPTCDIPVISGRTFSRRISSGRIVNRSRGRGPTNLMSPTSTLISHNRLNSPQVTTSSSYVLDVVVNGYLAASQEELEVPHAHPGHLPRLAQEQLALLEQGYRQFAQQPEY